MTEWFCVICGHVCNPTTDPRECVTLWSDPRTKGFGLGNTKFSHDWISFHMHCELSRQAKVRELEARKVSRRGLRWRRRIRLWQRLLGMRPRASYAKAYLEF